MPLSRRQFLNKSVLAAAACGAGPAFSWAREISEVHTQAHSGKDADGSSNWLPHASALDRITRDSFSRAVGAPFAVYPDARSSPVWLRLLSVKDLPPLDAVDTANMAVPPKAAGATRATSGFVLFFSGPAQPALGQKTYLFQNSELGEFALLVVPAASSQYCAVVNRLASIA